MSLLLSEDQIAVHVNHLADRIATRHADESFGDFICVILMDGAMVFAADLLRALYRRSIDPEVTSLGLSSYGHGRESSGTVTVSNDSKADFKGRTVLIFDDVLESGRTLDFAKKYLSTRGASRVMACVFAQKPDDDCQSVADFVGWHAPDLFLVGYGLDDKGRHRGQPYISAVD